MTVDTSKVKRQMRERGDSAARKARESFDRGDTTNANFQSGVQAGMLAAMQMVSNAEREAFAERDAAVSS